MTESQRENLFPPRSLSLVSAQRCHTSPLHKRFGVAAEAILVKISRGEMTRKVLNRSVKGTLPPTRLVSS